MVTLGAVVEIRFTAMRRSGLTLLELTVVLAICGVLAGIAIPRFVGLRNSSSVRAAAGEVAAAFTLARQSAIARRAPVAVVLDTSAGVITVRSGRATVSQRPLRAIYSVAVSANRDSAVYDARGLGFGVSNITITVRRGSSVDTLTMSRLGRLTW
jgi:prepilin-type N-terminal cleavage/methylation domain-containing protein